LARVADEYVVTELLRDRRNSSLRLCFEQKRNSR
jgi:hypothetical protein